MEKEMKKLLLVAVSVGVFLLVTIVVAIIILTPKVQTEGTTFTSSVPYSQRVQPASDIMDNIPIQPAVIETRKPDETSGDIAEVDIDNGDSLTIQIPKPSTAAVPDNTEVTPSTVTIAPSPATAEKPVAAPVVVKPAQTAQPVAPRPASGSTLTSRPASTGTINDFWIQTGAFSAMVRAEDAKELLSSKGLVSLIENREINGKTWYRVRLGPYTSEKEAGYWLALVKSIDGFSDSQIRQTTRRQ